MFLQNCLQEKNYDNYHFIKLNKQKTNADNEYIKSLIHKLRKTNADADSNSDSAISNLPRGLFTEQILQALASKDKTSGLAKEIAKGKYNAAYIAQMFFTEISKDSAQEFYSYKRTYNLLNKLFDKRAKKHLSLEKKYYSNAELIDLTKKLNNKKAISDNKITRAITGKIDKDKLNSKINTGADAERAKEKYKQAYKKLTDNEKQIRLAKNSDLVLFLLAQNLLKKEFIRDGETLKKKNEKASAATINFGNDFKLSQISPNNENSLLSLQTEVELQLEEKSIVNFMKIKNYGDFRGVLKDRRITGLLPYVIDKTVQYAAIKQELEWYNETRVKAFEIIHNFENRVIKQKGLQKNEKGLIDHNTILKSIRPESDEKFDKLIKLRNAYCHSEYPAYEVFGNDINGAEFNLLADYNKDNVQVKQYSIAFQIFKLTEKYYNELTNTITN